MGLHVTIEVILGCYDGSSYADQHYQHRDDHANSGETANEAGTRRQRRISLRFEWTNISHYAWAPSRFRSGSVIAAPGDIVNLLAEVKIALRSRSKLVSLFLFIVRSLS